MSMTTKYNVRAHLSVHPSVNKIEAINALRTATKCSLKYGKDMIELAMARQAMAGHFVSGIKLRLSADEYGVLVAATHGIEEISVTLLYVESASPVDYDFLDRSGSAL